MQGLFRTRGTTALQPNEVDILAKFHGEVAFGYQPKRNTKVELLICLLQFKSVLLKSESSNVWDCLENTNYPIF
jgi:hypothetical protein